MSLSLVPGGRSLRLGYLRLIDSAPLIMARELGLFDKYDLRVTLEREVSWANLRDKLLTGALDAAQMLAPMPLASALGAGGVQTRLLTGLALSLNGNAITVSPRLAAAIADQGGNAGDGAAATAQALGDYLRKKTRRNSSTELLTLAATHSFSCHTLLLRLWLRAGGTDPDRQVRIIVLPPEQMVDNLARGQIDGYCVGEPWNTRAVQSGIGSIQATGYGIANNRVEKVLAVTDAWHQANPFTHLRLRMALMEAGRWLADPAHREQAALVLAQRQHLDVPVGLLRPALTGNMVFARGEEPVAIPQFHVFGRYHAGFPWHSEADWLLRQTTSMLGSDLQPMVHLETVRQTFRTDLYREAALELSWSSPTTDHRPSNLHRGAWEMEPGVELGADLELTA